jgi:hypothetical protein
MNLDGPELTKDELTALAEAATWYAKYHARIIAENADDLSAQAVGQRERYESLLDALHKLGIRLPSVDLLRQDLDARPQGERRAA